MINNTREILDVPKILKMRENKMSPITYSTSNYPKFCAAVDALCIPSLHKIPESQIEKQYKRFLVKIYDMHKAVTDYELVKIDPKEVFKRLFKTTDKEWEGIEIILAFAAVAAVKISCESIIESYVRKYEYCFAKRTNHSEEGTNDAFDIVMNGPNLTQCDKIVEEALDKYFGDKNENRWHFLLNPLRTPGGYNRPN